MEGQSSSPRLHTPSCEFIEPLTLTKEQYQAALAAVMREYSKGNPPVQPVVGDEMQQPKKIAPSKGCSKL